MSLAEKIAVNAHYTRSVNLERDADSPEQARRMLAAQASRQERLDIADDVIVNSGSLEETRNQVSVLAKRYSRLAAHRSRRARSPGTP